MPSAHYQDKLPDVSDLKYDPETGLISRRHRQWGRWRPVPQTRTKKGYLRMKIAGTLYLQHVVAFFIMEGRLPRAGWEVDHRDGVGTNNSWDNLRETSHNANGGNRVRHRVHGKFPGVVWREDRQKFYAVITIGGKVHRFGGYDTEVEASDAYRRALMLVETGKLVDLTRVANRIRGAHFNKKTGKWQAWVTSDKTRIYLGTFDTEEMAVAAYRRAKEGCHAQSHCRPADRKSAPGN